MTPPRPRDSAQTLAGPPPVRHVDHGIPRDERETPNEGTDLSDLQMLGPLGPPEAVQHLCNRLGAVDARLQSSGKELLHQRQIIERTAEHAKHATVTADNTLTRLLEELGPLKATVERVKEALFQLLPLPESLSTLARAVVDLQKAVVRLDERLARTERRGESHNEIVERVAVLHIEDETTEVRARSLNDMQKHEARMVAIGWAKRAGKWLFAGGGMVAIGAAAAAFTRSCGG